MCELPTQQALTSGAEAALGCQLHPLLPGRGRNKLPSRPPAQPPAGQGHGSPGAPGTRPGWARRQAGGSGRATGRGGHTACLATSHTARPEILRFGSREGYQQALTLQGWHSHVLLRDRLRSVPARNPSGARRCLCTSLMAGAKWGLCPSAHRQPQGEAGRRVQRMLGSPFW